jgi:hypothetical protein
MEAHLIFKDCRTVNDCAEKLNKLIESWPVVYALENNSQWYMNQYAFPIAATRKARLAFIEEIVKEPCKHEVVFTDIKINWGIKQSSAPNWRFNDNELVHTCRDCKVELQATWSEKK